ncbi:MAG: hypothetical protein KAY32_01205, partial [Candidatus Eisenbacteria sp.]|nr:hypothetical protein [Candidatus Eisenbacteria bacterium]
MRVRDNLGAFIVVVLASIAGVSVLWSPADLSAGEAALLSSAIPADASTDSAIIALAAADSIS